MPGTTTEKLANCVMAHSDIMQDTCNDYQTFVLNNLILNNSIGNFYMDYRCIQELSLHALNITHIPNDFAYHLSNLTSLDLSNNKIRDIPYSFHLLSKLERLNIENNYISSLPISFSELKNLKELNIANNEIKELPETFGILKYLEHLNLSKNKLKNLPVSCTRLNRLICLFLHNNYLYELPECVTNGMKNLSILDVSSNPNILLHKPPASIQLSKFLATWNGLCHFFPQWLLSIKYCKLKDIVLDGTSFKSFHFPDEQFTLQVVNLSMVQSHLSYSILMNIIKNMTKLESLNVSNVNNDNMGNTFWQLPLHNLRNPRNLKTVNLRMTGLACISKSLYQLHSIVVLDIGSNSISWLPEEFCEMRALEVLIIDDNELIYLPENIGNIQTLQEIRANCNNLTMLPDSMVKLKNLRLLDLYDNDFQTFPEVLGNLKSLKALDIDQNCLDICCLRIRNVPYENMREILYQDLKIGLVRKKSDKLVIESENEEYHFVSHSESECSEDMEDTSTENFASPMFINEISSEENWDISEDSTDDFDPTGSNEPQIKPCNIYMSHENIYCPADIHATPIKIVVKETLEVCRLPVYEEGQFDDI